MVEQKVVYADDLINQMTGNVPIISKTVKIGGFKNANEIHRAFKKEKMSIDIYAKDILGKIILTDEVFEINIKVVSLADLGFNFFHSVPYSNVCKQGEKAGLKLCPQETGPYFRLQYPEQPDGEWFEVASKPIVDSKGKERIFTLGNKEKQELTAHYATKIVTWNVNDRFAFMVP